MTQRTTAKIGTPALKGTILYGIAKNELPEGFEKSLRKKVRAGKTKEAAREIAMLASGYSKDALLFALFQVFSAQDSTMGAAQFLVEVAQSMGLDDEV